MNNTAAEWLQNRVTLVTGKSTAELKAIGEEINSRAFYVSKLSVAAIANPLREISDGFVNGSLTLQEAQEKIRQVASGSPDEIARQLMRRSRARQILQTQRQMARGVAEWQSWQENKDDFPYIIYHANNDGWVRPSHKALDGKVFRVDDPFLQTHMPGEWDYNCRCWGEQVTKKRGEREAEKTGGVQPPGQATYDAESGFMFNPSNAFRPNVSELKDKTEIVQSMADSIRNKNARIRKMGMIVSNPGQTYQRADLSGLNDMTAAMKKIQPAAEASAAKAQWDPKRQPGYGRQADKYKENNPEETRKLPESIRQNFPGEIQVGSISSDTCTNAGISAKDAPVILDVGGKDDGLIHNWIHHKEVFVDPAEGERIIRATLGNPNSQVSVTFEKQEYSNGRSVFRQILTFFDPETKSYCVLRYDEQTGKFRLMSWHRSSASYGEGEWEIRGKEKIVIDENGNPQRETDKDRKIAYWKAQHGRKKTKA